MRTNMFINIAIVCMWNHKDYGFVKEQSCIYQKQKLIMKVLVFCLIFTTILCLTITFCPIFFSSFPGHVMTCYLTFEALKNRMRPRVTLRMIWIVNKYAIIRDSSFLCDCTVVIYI